MLTRTNTRLVVLLIKAQIVQVQHLGTQYVRIYSGNLDVSRDHGHSLALSRSRPRLQSRRPENTIEALRRPPRLSMKGMPFLASHITHHLREFPVSSQTPATIWPISLCSRRGPAPEIAAFQIWLIVFSPGHRITQRRASNVIRTVISRIPCQGTGTLHI